MPLFELGEKSGVYVESTHEVFRRGVRLNRPTVRRIQDQYYIVLATLGMDSREISQLEPVCPRQCRNLVARDGEMSTDAALRRLATECALRDGEHWSRRVRDAVIAFLVSLGMDPEDTAAIIRFHRNPVNVRQRIVGVPPGIASKVSAAAWRVRREIKPTLDGERAKREAAREPRIPHRRRATARRPRTIAMAAVA
jgi:hypothetical protein